MSKIQKIGVGGGCHWCTEAVFQVLKGVERVEQGYISTSIEPDQLYEGVIVHFNPGIIDLETLIRIHLQTHQSKKNHSLRSRYLSAVYTFTKEQFSEAENILDRLSRENIDFITEVFHFGKFRKSREQIRNYYRKDPQKPFCKRFIDPKLKIIQDDFVNYLK